jgi:hypothetical protein
MLYLAGMADERPCTQTRLEFRKAMLWNSDVCSSLNSEHCTIHLRYPQSAPRTDMAGFCSIKGSYVSISFMKMNGTR